MAHVLLAVALLSAPPAWEGRLPISLDLELIRALPVQHDGRWPPLDTMARDTVESITGEVFFHGHDPVLLLLAWTFEPQTWRHHPLIPIRNVKLRTELGLPETQTVYSFEDLVGHQRLRLLLADLAGIPQGRGLDPLEAKVSDISEQLQTLHDVFAGEVIRLIPDPEEVTGRWDPIAPPTPSASNGENAAWSAWVAVGQALVANDAAAFTSATRELAASLATLPAAHRVDPKLIATELRYNRLEPFRAAWKIMVVGALLAAVALGFRTKATDLLAVIGMLAGFAVLSYGLWLRWRIAGRIPAANMFESLLFLSWGMGAFAIFSMLIMRNRTVPLTASIMGALVLFMADVLPLDSYIRPIVPVLLDTVWMSIHVPVIMVSYSVLALAMLIAHVQLVVMAFAPNRRMLIARIDGFHYWHIQVGSILLLAGIITGSMWAASSWGRYWGWDPKEVWSLIAFLGYLVILHVRLGRGHVAWWGYLIGAALVTTLFVVVVPQLRPLSLAKGLALSGTLLAMVFFLTAQGRLATALKSVLCFWLIVMTYVGVNFVLGIGLHSYGFGKGAVAQYMLLIGGMDLAVALTLCAVHLVRGVIGSSSAPGEPALAPGSPG